MAYEIPDSKKLREMSSAELRKEIRSITEDVKAGRGNEKLLAVRNLLRKLRGLNEVEQLAKKSGVKL